MKLMDRYLLRQYLPPVAYCLVGFSMVFVVFDLFDHFSKFMKAKTPVLHAVWYYTALLAPTLEYLAPAALLLATLYTLWLLTRNNELTALRASGVSIYRITLPFLLVGLVFSIGVALVKELIAPQAAQWAEDFKHNNLRVMEHKVLIHKAYYNSHTRREWLVEQIDLKNPQVLIGVSISQERDDGTRISTVMADEARWLDGAWWLFDAAIQNYTTNDNPDGIAMEVEGSELGMRYPELTERPEDFLIELREWEFLSSLDMWRFLQAHPNLSEEAEAQRLYDLHSRIAIPWACFIVTLFGVPAGIRHGRQSAMTGIIVGIACFFGFYALIQIGLFLGRRMILAPWLAAWLSHIIFVLAGLLLLKRLR